jgi:hypothetical protein
MAEDDFYSSGNARNQREVSVEIPIVEPGEYIIVPCTSVPNVAGNFTITVYTPKSATSNGPEIVNVSVSKTPL